MFYVCICVGEYIDQSTGGTMAPTLASMNRFMSFMCVYVRVYVHVYVCMCVCVR